jgi:hypothetical protein
MNKKIISYFALLALFVSACGAQATPTMSGEDVQNTAAAAAFTVVAETQNALPTNTLVLPTEIPTETAQPTETLAPSPTVDTLLSTPAVIPTFTPQASTSNSNPCNKALLSWQGDTTSFSIVNETNPKGKIILLMSVVTKYGECGWLNIYSNSFSGPVGTYSAGAFVEGKKDFKVFGVFQVTEGSWKVIVRNDTIVAKGSCYPNC